MSRIKMIERKECISTVEEKFAILIQTSKP
jgi:hypothetical protein